MNTNNIKLLIIITEKTMENISAKGNLINGNIKIDYLGNLYKENWIV
jgi:hypothetical protein